MRARVSQRTDIGRQSVDMRPERPTSLRAAGPIPRRASIRAPVVTSCPSLVINPRRDSALATAAEALVDAGEPSLVGLQVRLRDRHPEAVVRPRDPSGESDAVWYLYHDGHWFHDGHWVANRGVGDGGEIG